MFDLEYARAFASLFDCEVLQGTHEWKDNSGVIHEAQYFLKDKPTGRSCMHLLDTEATLRKAIEYVKSGDCDFITPYKIKPL